MKLKGMMLCALLAMGGSAMAQDETTEMQATQGQPAVAQQSGVGGYNSKNLDDILPKAGDLALGLDGSPIFQYFGNMFNNSTNNDPKTYLSNVSPIVYMRYYLSDKLAVRARIQWRGKKTIHTVQVPDQSALAKDPLSAAKVEDRMVARVNSWHFGAGAQYFRGYGRLRGFVGGDLDYTVGRDVDRFYYGNKMTADNKAPMTGDFSGMSSPSAKAQRSLVLNNGWEHNIGLAAFVGVEYYFLPKMCVGVESGATMSATLRGRAKTYSERFVGDTYHGDWVETIDNNPEVDFTVATENPGNHFYANFYFLFHF